MDEFHGFIGEWTDWAANNPEELRDYMDAYFLKAKRWRERLERRREKIMYEALQLHINAIKEADK